jgi:hypothetical protein
VSLKDPPSRFNPRTLPSFAAILAALGNYFQSPQFAPSPVGSIDLLNLRIRSDADVFNDLPAAATKLKMLDRQRPRAWRTWRGSQRTGKRKYAR